VPELQETLEKPELRTSELGHLRAALRAAQHGNEGDDEDLDEIVPNVLGARIGYALERRDEKLHGWTPRCGVLSRIHDSQLCKRYQLRSYAIPLPRAGGWL
jgi:hypothetical protein